jgi:hypothetical protein
VISVSKVCNGLLSRWLFKVLDTLSAPMKLSNWLHGIIDVLDGGKLILFTANIANSTGLATMFTVPKGEIWELVSVYAASANQTYDWIGLRINPADTSYMRVFMQTAASPIYWYNQGSNRLILFEDTIVLVNVAVSSNVGVGNCVLRRITVR